jgi:hypothetical protein
MLVELLTFAVVVVVAGAFANLAIDQLSPRKRQREWRGKNAWRWNKNHGEGGASDQAQPKQWDAADQLRIVMSADFTIQPLLNKGEARLFKQLDRMVIACNPAWQVMAQVSLGEVLRCKDRDAYSCINSKRVDLLLMDEDCQPRHAIEYQGGGHYRGTAAARDAVKKEALRRAGIGYYEIVAGQTTPDDLRRLVEKLVDKPGTPNWPPVVS